MSLPNEAPFASFFAQKQPWVLEAQCAGAEDVFLPDKLTAALVSEARDICAVCPVRVECGEQALLEEGNADLSNRYFVRAYMTPAQRLSVTRRGGLKGRDPMLLVQGWDGDREIPPVPDDGDRWSKHHTTLARRLVRWLQASVEVGAPVPSKVDLQAHLGCNPAPLERVLDALVQDGTLDIKGRGYLYRGGLGVVGLWLPPHLRDDSSATLEDAHEH